MSSFKTIHEACAKGDLEDVKRLLTNSKDIKNQDNHGKTPLHVAIENEKKDIVEYLLKRGASTKTCDEMNRCALHYACDKGNYKIFEMILDKTDDVDTQDDDEEDTPLHVAVKKKHIKIAVKLIESYASFHKKDRWKKNPMHTAAEEGLYEVIDAILTQTDDCSIVNEEDNRSDTPLHLAVDKNHIDIARLLLKCGADPNMCNDVWWRPLNSACENGNYDMVKLLLRNFARPNYGKKYGAVCLTDAIRGGHVDIVRLLLKYKADPNKMDEEEGETPWLVALSNHKLKKIKILAEDRDDDEEDSDDEEEDEQMEVDGDEQEDDEDEELEDNCKEPDVDTKAIIDLLLRSGKVDVNDKGEYDPCLPPLHLAASDNNHELAENLLQRGADVRGTCDRELQAMHYAVYNNSPKMVKLLLRYGASVNCRDENGNTPLHYYQDCKMLSLLFENGADVNIVNNNFEPAVRPSCARHKCPAVKLLKKLVAADFVIEETIETGKFQRKLKAEDPKILEYKEEIARARTIIVNYKNKMTLFDLMCKNIHVWASYVDNVTLDKLYGEQKDFRREFPHYGFLLNFKFRRAQDRKAAMNFAQTTFDGVTGASLTEENYKTIFKYFDNFELKERFALPEKKPEKKSKRFQGKHTLGSDEYSDDSDDSVAAARIQNLEDSEDDMDSDSE